jgi:hypothetical protein
MAQDSVCFIDIAEKNIRLRHWETIGKKSKEKVNYTHLAGLTHQHR